VRDVERAVGERQLVDTAFLVAEVVEATGERVATSRLERVPREGEADHLPRGESLGQAARDAAGAAAYVEQPHVRPEVRQEERRRFAGRALGVLAHERPCVAMGVELVPERLVGSWEVGFPA